MAACPGCGGDVEGRIDKKWCSEKCRGANRDQRDYNARYYAARRPERLLAHKEWRSQNREHVNRERRKWVAANRDHITEYQREYQSQWQTANRLRRREYSARRRSRVSAGGSFELTPRDYSRALARNGGRCTYCSAPADEWDHVVPLARGGRHAIGNLVPACLPCNRRKGPKTVTEWRKVTDEGFDLQSLTVL